ncbi:MAG: hypothetical protein ABJN26_06160 [Stappiaceae bacterium]
MQLLLRFVFGVLISIYLTVGAIGQPVKLHEMWVKTYGKWRAVLYQNHENSKLFCAAETKGDIKAQFRIVNYFSGDSFIEVFGLGLKVKLNNPTQSISKKFTFKFDGDKTIRLVGGIDEFSIYYDLKDESETKYIYERLSEKKTLIVFDDNEKIEAKFSLSGSGKAIKRMLQCIKEKG